MSIEAMRQALEVLEQINQLSIGENAIALPGEIDAAMDNLRAAIEQGEKQDYIKLEAAYFSGLADGKEVVEQYDQTSLELCKECGWKAVIPGDGCLVCARQKAKPVWIPRTHLEAAQREPSMCRVEPTKRLPDFVPLYTEPPTDSEPFAYSYMGIRHDGSTHGPHLTWEPEYMDAMSASKGAIAIPLYAAPRQWVGLTDEEVHEGFCHVEYETPNDWNTDPDDWCQQFARYLEAKLKEKNT